MDLDDPRTRINSIDDEILELLGRRRAAVGEILAAKKAQGLPLRDGEREEELLVRLIRRGRELGLEPHFVTGLFHAIIAHQPDLDIDTSSHLALIHDDETPALIDPDCLRW